MPITWFHGFVVPTTAIRKLSGGPGSWDDDPTLKGVIFRFNIIDSVVSVSCETKTVDQVPPILLYVWAFLTVRGALDAYSFVHGASLTLTLNECTHPDGQKMPLLFIEPDLADICTVSVRDIFDLSRSERGILKHLHDLGETISNPLDSEVNCARAVDGFARLLLPGKSKEAPRWRKLQDSLNLTEDYVKFVSALSAGPRHGTIEPQSLNDIIETRRRAWAIANRFLEFRKRGSVKLSQPEFPKL
jgi:hypothetical protein